MKMYPPPNKKQQQKKNTKKTTTKTEKEELRVNVHVYTFFYTIQNALLNNIKLTKVRPLNHKFLILRVDVYKCVVPKFFSWGIGGPSDNFVCQGREGVPRHICTFI